MHARCLPALWTGVLAVAGPATLPAWLSGCAERPPFVVLSIEDESGAAAGWTKLHIGTSRASLGPVRVAKAVLPLAVTVTSPTTGDRTVWVEVRDVFGLALARGVTTARFAQSGTPTATVRLAKVCTAHSECRTDSFCAGTRECREDMCVITGLPCASSFACVQAQCIDLGGGEGTCNVTLDDSVCGAGSYCTASAGCVPRCGNGVVEAGETCDDGDTRDTDNGCDAQCQRNDVCGDGWVHTLFEHCDDGDYDECNGCRTNCTRGCICATAQGCDAVGEWCDDGICTGCSVVEHCGPSCSACAGATPLCGGTSLGCVCSADPGLGPRGSCYPGTYCRLDGICTSCAETLHCGQDCGVCTGDTPECGGAEVGCIVDPPNACAGRPSFTPCRMASPARSYNICIGGTCQEPGCPDASCVPRGPSFAKKHLSSAWEYPDTNQRTCHSGVGPITCTAFPCDTYGNPLLCGQDAQYGWDVSHPASDRYEVRMDGGTGLGDDVTGEPAVTDLVSGLVWQGCPAGLTGAACSEGGTYVKTQAEALVYCDSLTWNRFSDWRLPDMYELLSIVDRGRTYPSIDLAGFPNTRAASFWTSSPATVAPDLAWLVDFTIGRASYTGPSGAAHVRCVRGQPIPDPTPRFTRIEPVPASGQEIVTDARTGLVWQGCVAGFTGALCTGSLLTFSWSAAMDRCETLSWGNATDWRLPSVVELESLLDIKESGMAIDATAFPGMTNSWLWSSSSFLGSNAEAWQVSFAVKYAWHATKGNAHGAFCVRG